MLVSALHRTENLLGGLSTSCHFLGIWMSECLQCSFVQDAGGVPFLSFLLADFSSIQWQLWQHKQHNVLTVDDLFGVFVSINDQSIHWGGKSYPETLSIFWWPDMLCWFHTGNLLHSELKAVDFPGCISLASDCGKLVLNWLRNY